MRIEKIFNHENLPQNIPQQKITKSFSVITLFTNPKILVLEEAIELAEKHGYQNIFYEQHNEQKSNLITSHYCHITATIF